MIGIELLETYMFVAVVKIPLYNGWSYVSRVPDSQ